jgi:hypothetical protein
MNTIPHSSPFLALALVSRRQCVQAYSTRTYQTSLMLYHSYTKSAGRNSQNLSIGRHVSTKTATGQNQIKISYNPSLRVVKKPLASNISSAPHSPSQTAGYQTPAPTTLKLSPTQLTQSIPPYIPDCHFNPPSSTRPAPLELPVRQPKQSTIGYYIKLGRAYLTFYKRGLQAINASRKAAKQIRTRVKAHQKEFQKILRVNPQEAERMALEQQAPWTRAEFQLLKRSSHDMSRLPIFGLLFVVCGEFLPLVMFAFKTRITPWLPNTVRLPSQVAANRTKLLAHREVVEKKWEGEDVNKESVDTFARYGAEYFELGPKLWPLNLQPKYVILRHTRIYYEYLLYDDVLLGEKGVMELRDEEVIISAIERGLWDEKTEMLELRQRLQKAVLRSMKPIDSESIYDKNEQ